jgi:hypothetical protein
VAFTKVRHDRELFAAAGIGPGDAYMALWSHLIELRNSWQSTTIPESRNMYRHEYVDVLKAILPYERPRLAVVKVRTDQDAVREPEEMAKALAKALTPEELELLDKVALKLVSAPSTTHEHRASHRMQEIASLINALSQLLWPIIAFWLLWLVWRANKRGRPARKP